MNYEYKYHKYKNKYIMLKRQLAGNYTKNIRIRDQLDRYAAGEEVEEEEIGREKEKIISEEQSGDDVTEHEIVQTDEEEEVDELDLIDDDPVIRSTEQARPFILDEASVKDKDVPVSKLPEQIDIGIYGLARGIVRDKFRFGKDEFIEIKEPPNKKILIIQDIDSFDEFTEKYGLLGSDDEDEENEFIYIKWNKVADQYKGFYLNVGLSSERYSTATYKDKSYISWWENEYKLISGVIIFEEPIYERYKGYNITKPFSGNIYGENDFPQNNYIRYADGPDNTKILIIDNIDSFDEFTNKYGYLKEHKNKTKIAIEWKKIRKDYKGIYIDKDIEIYPERYKMSFYKGKKYISWWKYYRIRSGTVYIFA